MGEQGREMNVYVCVCLEEGATFFLTPLSDDFSPLSLRSVLQQRVFNSTREVFSLPSFFSRCLQFSIFRRRSKKVEVPPSISRRHNSRLSLPSLSLRGDRRRDGKGKVVFFTCGEADRSRHGKCCSSCCCCCWGDHFHFTSLMSTQKGCEKKNLCQKNRCEKGKLFFNKVGVKKENFS